MVILVCPVFEECKWEKNLLCSFSGEVSFDVDYVEKDISCSAFEWRDCCEE